VGYGDTITAEIDFNGFSLPLDVGICQTEPTTGACYAAPTTSVTVDIAAGETPTFAVFAQATAPIDFDPATARIFVRFVDGSGNEHGATSVAIEAY